MNNKMTDPQSAWAGDFGAEYTARNVASKDALRSRTMMWARIGQAFHDDPPRTILEVGCNLGINLRVLSQLFDVELSAIEPNPVARETLAKDGVLAPKKIYAGFGDNIPVADGAVEMSFTSGVLIHVDPARLDATMDEIHRVTSKYIMCAEYFSPRAETLSYRGRDGLLFRNDFGGLYMDRFPGLRLVDYGFFWKRATGLDDVTWWLFRKT